MYALVDCNNFYASCERIFRPALEGKPICVLSNNDGCVIARSNEAKAIGIPMGAPSFEWEQTFIENNVAVFSANFELYGDISDRVMTILSDFSPAMEVYSIDEMFLDFTGCKLFDLRAVGNQMREQVLKNTGIPTSIGFAPTKALAKLANRIAKQFPVWQSVFIMNTDEGRIKALKWLPIKDVWGIGRQHAKKLLQMGVKTAYDFTQMDEGWIRKYMSVVELRLKRDLEGKPTIMLEEVAIKKNIATTRSFDRNYTDINDLKERVTTFAVSCAEKLRKQGSVCTSVTVFIHTNEFRQDLPQYSRNFEMKLPFPTNSNIELARFAVRALEIIYRKGFAYKKAGVIVNKLTPENQKQLTIFEVSNERHKKLMGAVDKLNAMFGQQKIRLASQDSKRVWKMKQEHLSPRSTTRLSEIVKIKI